MDIESIIKNGKQGLYIIAGAAGAGKTTLSDKLKDIIDCSVYSADYRFIGNSQERKMLINSKQILGIYAFIDAINQYNWWNWNDIEKDITNLLNGEDVILKSPYDRDKGVFMPDINIKSKNYILFEGNNVSHLPILEKANLIFIIRTPEEICLQRLIAKDKGRRSFKEILARFLITSYSEGLCYEILYKCFKDKIVNIDMNGNMINYTAGAEDINFAPIQI